MQILKVIGNILLTGLISLAFLAAWGATVLAVYRSTGNRRLSTGERVFWVALAVVLPFVGALIYLLARISGVLVTPPPPEPVGRQEGTEVMEGGFYGAYPPQSHVAARTPEPPSRETPPAGAAAYPARESTTTGRPRPANLRLQVVEGPCTGILCVLDHLPALIGRGMEAAIRLDDDHRVSRRHAEIFLRDGALFLRDLGSLHGTSLNGAPLGEAPLNAGDTILVGDSTIQVR